MLEKDVKIIALLSLLKFLATPLVSQRRLEQQLQQKHTFGMCDHSVIEQPCFQTYE